MGYELLLSADDILLLCVGAKQFVVSGERLSSGFFYYEVSVRLLLGDVLNNHE